MLLECAHCGAPLDVRDGTTTSRCRYCGHTSRIAQLRTILPETPRGWRPPPTWTPPPHVPADSNQTLRYARSSASSFIVLGAIIAVLVGIGASLAFVRSVRTSSPFAAGDAAVLDAIRFDESSVEMAKKPGASSYDGRFIRVNVSGPFEYASINYDEKDRAHPVGAGFHADRKACTSEIEALRDRLKKRLGRRFDGKSWRWGPMSLNFDEKCASVNFNVYLSPVDEPTGDWKRRSETMWKALRADLFGRADTVDAAAARDDLATGYEPAKIAKLVAGSTIDDVANITKKLPAASLRKIGSLEVELPLGLAHFGSVKISYRNQKAGGIERVSLDGYANKLEDHIDVAECLAKKIEGKLEIKETDYMNKKRDAQITLKGAGVYVTMYGAGLTSWTSDAIPENLVRSFIEAAASC